MDGLALLEKWYAERCNGDWEHQYGVKIDTLDNPGWQLTIDLCGTPAENRALERQKIERTDGDWIHYWVEKKQFRAAMGAQNLSEAVAVFDQWFRSG